MVERLFVVAALPSEARPLVNHWGLKRLSSGGPYPVYQSACGARSLIVSGVGKVAAAAAVGYLAGHIGAKRSDAWLNVGIAGSGEHGLGTLVVGHKVVDVGAAKSWYPSQLFQGPRLRRYLSAVIRTFEEEVTDYPGDGVVEMEAAGFVGAAMRHSSVELVQVVKVVSDTPEEPASGITPEGVSALITDKLEEITALGTELGALSGELAVLDRESPEVAVILERWRFSVSGGHQLRRLMRRWDLLFPTESPFGHLERCATSKAVLKTLAAELKSAPVQLLGAVGS